MERTYYYLQIIWCSPEPIIFSLWTQWFSSKNSEILILKYFQLPDSGPRACEQAWEPTGRERSQPRPTPTLISTPWSATPPPPSSSQAPGPPPPAAPTVIFLQVRKKPRRWSLPGPTGCNLLTLIEMFLRVADPALPWEMRFSVLLSGDDTTRSP